MNLGFLFPIGGGFKDLEKSGQDKRFEDLDLSFYARNFQKVFIFSYFKELRQLPKNCLLMPNNNEIHRYIYQFILPLVYRKEFQKISIFRASHLTATIPAIVAKIIYHTPFIFNYGYDYISFSKIKGEKIKSSILRFWELIALRMADGVIVATPNLKRKIDKLKVKNISLIPNGVNASLFKPVQKEVSKGINILFVGRLEKQKNLPNLIKAIAKLNNRNIKLQFIGNGSQKAFLISVAKKLRVNLKIINQVKNDLLPKHYQMADIFVLVSFNEGHPKVMLEAQSCGVPVLASETFASQFIKDKETGILCKTTIEDISEKIGLLIKNKQLRSKIRKNARRNILENYSIQKLLTKELVFIRKCLKN